MLLPNPVGTHMNTEFPWYTRIPNSSRVKDSAEEKVSLLLALALALAY